MSGRILHLISGLRKGGAEGQLYRLGGALRERGWDQAVVSLESGGVWKEPLLAAGIRVHEIPRTAVKPWRAWRLRRLAARERPDVLVSWSAHAAVYARFARPAAGKLVFNVRGDLTVDRDRGEGPGRLGLYRGALEAADLVVANSAFGLDALRRGGVRLPASAVVGNIVAAPGRARPWEPAAVPRVAAVGSLKRLKAYDVLLRALGALAGEGRRFELLVAGTGPERPALERLAGELGLGGRVRFLGELEDPAALLRSCHLLAHPSRTEGLCNAVLEAMGEGLPVAACRVGGNPEIVEHGHTGLLAPPDAPEALARHLAALLGDADLRGRLGAEALRRVRERCSAGAVAGRYEALLQGLA